MCGSTSPAMSWRAIPQSLTTTGAESQAQPGEWINRSILAYDHPFCRRSVPDRAGTCRCSLPRRDAVDARVISDVINGTGKVILRQSEVGGYPIMNSVLAPVDTDWDGMPDMWEIYNGLDPYDPEDRNLDRDDDGYTNLEEYLNAIVAGHPLGE